MTAKQLIKALEKIVAEHGNVKVGASWEDLRDSSNGTYTVANISGVEVEVVNQVDGDGFTITNKDGTERTKKTAVLR